MNLDFKGYVFYQWRLIFTKIASMFKAILTPLVFVLPAIAFAQDVTGFAFGRVASSELALKSYAPDTTAAAFVMAEFGDAHVDYEDPNKIIYEYHIKIKILKQSEVGRADIEIPLFKSEGKEEIISRIYASSFNADGSRVIETKLEKQGIFTEKNKKSHNYVKFAIPNVRAGSIIEYQYKIETPFLFNFRNWEFQSDIPKVRSEYHTSIPANYKYNITLRGFYKLDSHEGEVQRECLRFGTASADCEVNKYVMKNIPAFKEEEYMLSKENYMSRINFELSEVQNFDGQKWKYTKEWKDVDVDMKNRSDFGVQLKRGKDVVDGAIDVAILGETDSLTKAKKIYDFIKYHYTWNGVNGNLSDLGIKKAFEAKTGNVGDINLTLVAALRYAGFKVDPVLLATRSWAMPIEIHPVLSDFNYVIARLTLNKKVYLLDAVDDLTPFGSIPYRCYNGKGRVMEQEGSYWMELKPTDKERTVTIVNLVLKPDGNMTGTITETSFGYAALEKRNAFYRLADEKAYLEELKKKNSFVNIVGYERSKDEDLSKPVNEKYSIEFSAFDSPETTSFLFNPFIVGRNETNPFKSDSRTYPVDFAVPKEESVTISIELPENFVAESLPDKVGLALPNAGGKFIYGTQVIGNKLQISNILTLSRPVYSSQEYPFLKEIYTRMVQAQNTDIIFKRK